jgi:hypothetical protein
MESVTLQPWNNGSGTPPPATTDGGVKPTSDTPDDGSTRHTVGLSLAIFGGAAIAFGAFSGIEALSKASAYNDPNGQHLPEDKTNGLTYRTLADVSFVVGLASGGIGAYLLLTKPEAAGAASTPSASIGVVPGGLSVRGRF